MKKKVFWVKVLTVLAVTAVVPAWSAAAERTVRNGHLAGQSSAPMETDFVLGVKTPAESGKSKDGYGWNGHLSGQSSSALKTDLSVLPASGSGGKGAWNGYLGGSLSVWQQEL